MMQDSDLLSGSTIVARGDGYVEAQMNGETVLMQIDSGKFFSLSGTGIRVWKLMDGRISIADLTDALIQEFAVDREECLRDVIALCRDLSKNALINVAP